MMEKTHYGIGWKSGKDEKERYWVGHSGGSVDGTTWFVVYPKQEVVVAIISNLSDVDYNNIQLTIADKLYGRETLVPEIQLYASAGYDVVFYPNPRGSASYGIVPAS